MLRALVWLTIPMIHIVASSIHARSGLLLMLALAAAVGGIMLCLVGMRLFRQRRNFQPRGTQIGEATAGSAALHGLAQGESTITSAITARPCYYYHAIAWQQGPGRSRSWRKVAEEIELIPFWLDDMTGRVEVNAHGADMELLRDFHEEYGPATLQTHTDLPHEVTAFLARHNVATDRVVRIEEYRISPQSPLFVWGRLAEKEEGTRRSRSFNAPTPEPLAQPEVVYLSAAPVTEPATAMSMQSRLAAALSRAGAQNPAVWEFASPLSSIRRAYKAEAEPDSALMISKGEDAPLTISWRDRRQSDRGVAWPIAALLLGLILLVASSYFVLGPFR